MEFIYVIGALLLAAGLAWALARNAGRNRANDPTTEAATREQYDDPERYEQSTRRALERQLEPD